MFEDLSTLVDLMYDASSKFSEKTFLQYKAKKDDEYFTHITFGQFRHRVEAMSASLHHLGMRKGDKVGIISDNMYRWLISDMAVLSLGGIDVPRGSDSSTDEVRYILNHSEAKFCFVEDPQQADKVYALWKDLKHLKILILLTGHPSEMYQHHSHQVDVITFDELIEDGEKILPKLTAKLRQIRESVKAPDLATLIYTSGTTGPPKGVMLMHKNIMHNVKNLTDILMVSERDRWLSILPIWHIFERTIEYVIMARACSMAYSKPTANFLLPDMAMIRPTWMASVPRVWESLHNGIIKKLKSESAIKYGMFRFFVGLGRISTYFKKLLKNELPLFRPQFFVWTGLKKGFSALMVALFFVFDLLGDLLIFRKIRARTGGKLKGPVSGGGALPAHVDIFFSTIKIDILEGYGMTETSPVIAVRTFNQKVMSTVGKPIPKTEVRIFDEKGKPLVNQHERGIIHVRGDLVMKGYYKDEEKTRQVLSHDGWMNTGDIGRMTMTGDIQITGRAKDTIVLIGGENIEPAPIEAKILENPMVSHIMIYGQDKKHLSAVIVPDEDQLMDFAIKNKIPFKDFKTLCNNDQVLDEYNRIVNSKISTQNGFKSFERIYCFILVPEAFKIGEELTASLKMKRNFIAKKYGHEINLKCYVKFGK
jgi:long-chain acyl-CoA synthetase